MPRANSLTTYTILLTVVWVPLATAKCGQCSPNGFACLMENVYTPCMNGLPDLSQTYYCREGTTCTSTGTVCSADGPTDCPLDLSKCECASLSQLHACTSRTTFALCNGGSIVPKSERTCPAGKFCTTDPTLELCVSECALDDVPECNRAAP